MRIVLVVLMVVAAACAPDPEPVGGGSASTTTAPALAPTTAPAASRPGGAASTTAANSAIQPRRLPSGGRQPSQAPAAPRPAPAIAAPALGGPGSLAGVILRPQPATTVVLEVMRQQGAGPVQATVDHVARTLRTSARKPVDVPAPVALKGGATNWTAESLAATADAATAQMQGNARVVIRALFVRGTFEGKEDVLGVAVRGDVLAVFSDQIEAAATPLVPPNVIEDACTMHEVGHLLGLVDLVLNTGRQDSSHPGHSRNRESVMYYAVESGLVTQLLGGPPPTEFDDADRADLATIKAS